MIKYNLRNDTCKNHPMDKKWAILVKSSVCKNHLCTVVDNHNEVVNGSYTGKYAKLLLHISPRVREYIDAKLFDDFLYVSVWKDECIPTYTNWDYIYEELSDDQIVNDLETVLYDLQPMLECTTLAGYDGNDLFDDSNEKWGDYVLNDENEYRIIRNKRKVEFYRIHDDNKKLELIKKFDIDENRFRKAVDLYNIKSDICNNIDEYINTGEIYDKITEFKKYTNN